MYFSFILSLSVYNLFNTEHPHSTHLTRKAWVSVKVWSSWRATASRMCCKSVSYTLCYPFYSSCWLLFRLLVQGVTLTLRTKTGGKVYSLFLSVGSECESSLGVVFSVRGGFVRRQIGNRLGKWFFEWFYEYLILRKENPFRKLEWKFF